MTSQALTADAPRQPRSRWLIKRSRAASILLIGWLFIWVGGLVQPCCTAFAGNLGDNRATTQAVSMADTAPVRSADILGHENGPCQQTFAANAALPGQLFLLPAKVDHTPHLVVVSYFAPLSAVSEYSHSVDFYYPSPPPRTYLRTKRLLI